MKLGWPWRPAPRDRLLVLDDFFPNLLTGFRIAEYNAYLEAFPDVLVLSTLKDFDAQHARYARRYPTLAPRVQRQTRRVLARGAAAYVNFLNNAAHVLPKLERLDVPFGMTLYPGGGFGLREEASDVKLRRVLSSPLLRSLTVTQPVTEQYVNEFANHHGLRLPAMQLIPGVVVNPMYFAADLPPHGAYFGEGKPTFDVCFVAEKYMARGENKGYPEFIAMALALRAQARLRFHVVGSFSPDDIDVGALGERITFHGRVETAQLRGFFAAMDLVVSPNRPFMLHPGNFDGFPTGGCVEAALCGVAVMASDALKQNPGYPNGEAMLIVAPDVDAMVAAMHGLLHAPARVAAIARTGQALTRQWYAPDVQIGKRCEALQALASSAAFTLR